MDPIIIISGCFSDDESSNDEWNLMDQDQTDQEEDSMNTESNLQDHDKGSADKCEIQGSPQEMKAMLHVLCRKWIIMKNL